MPKVQCERDGTPIKWDDCIDTEETRMTTKFTCKVDHAVECSPKTSKICRKIEYTEWFEEPIKTCTNITILMPNQTWEHKQKCLFPDHGRGNKP